MNQDTLNRTNMLTGSEEKRYLDFQTILKEFTEYKLSNM